MVYDCTVAPWRPFRVLTYDDKKDNPVTSLSWSLDGTRLIAINSRVSGLCQVSNFYTFYLKTILFSHFHNEKDNL